MIGTRNGKHICYQFGRNRRTALYRMEKSAENKQLQKKRYKFVTVSRSTINLTTIPNQNKLRKKKHICNTFNDIVLIVVNFSLRLVEIIAHKCTIQQRTAVTDMHPSIGVRMSIKASKINISVLFFSHKLPNVLLNDRINYASHIQTTSVQRG